ncbi:MBL fold metallo-hydrolase [Tengunoibacter tsumagoiensis]|uniref:MBL fold metallo-hydrolase n=1 Tax=Tengunoibacter tsumagoiensis TaxID=2014871 RepID=A0A402A6P1_9CHLR|nr:MBL fold metallo-hydrolase [Tengunoibacter tsumagoiensis]GCE14810.1 MBL fold metallo-hydrolase [Tengunoibacter tsumagoiensis]
MEILSSHAHPLTIHIHTSTPETFFVNSYLVETAAGIVVIDTQFVLSQARAVKAQLDALGRPLAAIIITHPHPDHFNGTALLLEGRSNVPVYATPLTVQGIQAIEAAKRTEWKGKYGDDYPDQTYIPTHLIPSGKTVAIGGLTWRFEDLGPGEAANETVIVVDEVNILFCGDVMYHHVHSWLVEGRSSAWLAQLGTVLQHYKGIERIYPGHGRPTTLRALNDEVDYINTYQSLVRAELERSGSISPESKAGIKAQILQRYPATWPLASLIDYNIDGISKELG